MTDKALVVFTGKSRETLMSEGGTAHWVLNPAIVRNFDYVICVRHANPPYDPGPGSRPEPHGAAFLVAKIADLQVTGHDKDRDRYRVMFESVADVLVPNFWDGSRNPVRYMPLTDINARGIDFDKLDFKAVDPVEGSASDTGAIVPTNPQTAISPIGIADAKAGLAAMFGVPVEAIEITIKG